VRKGGNRDAEGQGGQGSSGLSPDAGQRRSGGGNKHADHALVRIARIMLDNMETVGWEAIRDHGTKRSQQCEVVHPDENLLAHFV